ncbi:MAG: Glu/Leu/Phe/Val dehydrogenase dimerization domain-containing protein [Patescibacteria group bacterium]
MVQVLQIDPIAPGKLEDFPEFDSHKTVYRFENSSVGLRGFIAIHNDNLGPATGGTRMFPYVSEEEALRDVLRLSRAMTYKCALAGVHHGGGKAVIIGDPENKSEQMLRAYAQAINEADGRFFTGEDVGITEDDVQVMLEESRFFIGRRGVAGDPSPYAAKSVFATMQVAAGELWGDEDLFNRSVAVKGAGKVGGELIRLLVNAGAKVIAADVKPAAIEAVEKKYPQVRVVDSATIHKEKVDIFSPCALGNDFTKENVAEVRAAVICGGANNQLASDDIGDWLFRRNILYVPDYVANAGGLINVVDELEKDGYNRRRVLERISKLKNMLHTIFLFTRQKHQPSNRVADQLAESIFLNGKKTSSVV